MVTASISPNQARVSTESEKTPARQAAQLAGRQVMVQASDTKYIGCLNEEQVNKLSQLFEGKVPKAADVQHAIKRHFKLSVSETTVRKYCDNGSWRVCLPRKRVQHCLNETEVEALRSAFTGQTPTVQAVIKEIKSRFGLTISKKTVYRNCQREGKWGISLSQGGESSYLNDLQVNELCAAFVGKTPTASEVKEEVYKRFNIKMPLSVVTHGCKNRGWTIHLRKQRKQSLLDESQIKILRDAFVGQTPTTKDVYEEIKKQFNMDVNYDRISENCKSGKWGITLKVLRLRKKNIDSLRATFAGRFPTAQDVVEEVKRSIGVFIPEEVVRKNSEKWGISLSSQQEEAPDFYRLNSLEDEEGFYFSPPSPIFPIEVPSGAEKEESLSPEEDFTPIEGPWLLDSKEDFSQEGISVLNPDDFLFEW